MYVCMYVCMCMWYTNMYAQICVHFCASMSKSEYLFRLILARFLKGAGISVVGGNCWHEVLNVLENAPDIREWVMQRYIPDPLLIGI